MLRNQRLLSGFVVLVLVGITAISSRAAITTTGDVQPNDPSGWNFGTTAYIGRSGSGTLEITDGNVVMSNYGYIGAESGSTGMVAVDGAGSTWMNDQDLYVGYDGSGTLNVANGGVVTVDEDTWVAHNSGSSGTIHFDGGTLITGGLLCASDDLTGTGTINTHGLVSDVDLIFDATHETNQTFTINDNPGQNITVNLNVYGADSLGAGFRGAGTMSISDGRVVGSTHGYIGYESGSTGVVTVDGAGSAWTNNYYLYVGREGSGTLQITNGGAVSNGEGHIGYYSGSAGVVTVDGAGSMWTNSGSLDVGRYGNGTLNISNGGTVSNNTFGVIGSYSGSTGVVTVDGPGSTWTNDGNLYVGEAGTGTLNITGGGAVSVAGTLTIDYDGDGDGFINMGGGGMLALWGRPKVH